MTGEETAAHSAPSVPGGGARPPARRRRRRLKHGLIAAAAAVVVAAIVAVLVPVPYDAITPGTGLDVTGLIAVPSAQRHHHAGTVVLTDVELVPLRALTYLWYALQSGDRIVPRSELTGPATSSQYHEQGVIDMATARRAAVVVGLRTLGYHVRAVPSGVIVYEPIPGSPAAASLAVGDVLTSLDGRAIPTVAALRHAVAAHPPGTAVTLTEHAFGSHKGATVRLRLGTVRLTPAGAERCLAPGAPTAGTVAPPKGAPPACVGITAPTVTSEQSYRTEGLPFGVTLHDNGIVGPSAGLSFTLGLIDVLAKGDLTGGRRVAATGTMSMAGTVGAVGGLAQKTAAVRAAGATVFLVPAGHDAAVARAHAGPDLKVLAVTSIGQAIADLEHLGGRLGPLPAPARS